MQKSKVLLLFGNHGSKKSCLPRNIHFFREYAIPALKQPPLQKRNTYLIFEFAQDYPFKTLSTEEKIQMIRDFSSRILDPNLNIRLQGFINDRNAYFDDFISGGQVPPNISFDYFGIKNEIIAENSKRHGSVIVRFEPADMEVIIRNWELSFAMQGLADLKTSNKDQQVLILSSYIRALAEYSFLRDSLLAEYIISVSQTSKSDFIVFRGECHTGLYSLLKDSNLELSYFSTNEMRQSFISQAVMSRYDHPLLGPFLVQVAENQLELIT